MTPAGVFWTRDAATGADPVRLSNFSIRIERQVIITDGVEERRELDLCATVGGQDVRITIPARQFASMSWVLDGLGPDAVTFPSGRDHLRAAIQLLSAPVPSRQVYGHLGWREIDGAMVYLTPAGAISAAGLDPAITVRPPDAVQAITLTVPPTVDDLRRAIRASLAMLDIAPDQVSVLILAAVYRAVLGGVDFGLHVHGRTGTAKTQLAALAQQHYGAQMDAEHLPGSWLSTVNANEQLLFDGKDALMVIDDFNPVGSSATVQTMHGDADRLFRAQGNRQGRQRMAQDLSNVPAKPPRGLMLSTGEDVPRGHSLRARAVLVEVKVGDINWQRLTACQQDAAAGRYSHALTGFVQSIAADYAAIQDCLAQYRQVARRHSTPIGVHQRTLSNLAQLTFGMELFLAFATEVGAITDSEREQYIARVQTALDGLIDRQRDEQAGADPAARFVELLKQAIASGRVHVADRDGQPPSNGHQPSAWGWREATTVVGKKTMTSWQPQGDRIGWIDGEVLYLKIDLAYAAVQALGRQVGDTLTWTKGTLVKRLAEGGMLLVKDGTRQTYAVRRQLEGRPQSVIAIAVSQLAGSRADDDVSDADPSTDSAIASVLRRVGVRR